MKRDEIDKILDDLSKTKDRNIVIIDFGNLQKWEESLKWKNGDFGYLLEYLKEKYDKDSIVFGARGHIGKEIYDAKPKEVVSNILYAEDFEYRLDRNRFRK